MVFPHHSGDGQRETDSLFLLFNDGLRQHRCFLFLFALRINVFQLIILGKSTHAFSFEISAFFEFITFSLQTSAANEILHFGRRGTAKKVVAYLYV